MNDFPFRSDRFIGNTDGDSVREATSRPEQRLSSFHSGSSAGKKIRRTRGRRAPDPESSRCLGFQTPDGDECKNLSVVGHESSGSGFGERRAGSCIRPVRSYE